MTPEKGAPVYSVRPANQCVSNPVSVRRTSEELRFLETRTPPSGKATQIEIVKGSAR